MAIKICYARSIHWPNYCQFFFLDAVSVVHQIVLVSVVILTFFVASFGTQSYLTIFPSVISRDDVSKSTIGDKVYATESYYDDYVIPDMAD